MAALTRKDVPVPATGVIGTVLGATALAGVLGQRGGDGGGGLLGGLFGNNVDNSGAMAVYKAQRADEGQAASTELSILKNYILPLMQRVCAVETQASVTNATTPLLIGISAEKANTDLREAMCCVPKGTPMLRPEQIGDCYHGAYNEILTRHYPRAFAWNDHGHDRHGCGCGHGPR